MQEFYLSFCISVLMIKPSHWKLGLNALKMNNSFSLDIIKTEVHSDVQLVMSEAATTYIGNPNSILVLISCCHIL